MVKSVPTLAVIVSHDNASACDTEEIRTKSRPTYDLGRVASCIPYAARLLLAMEAFGFRGRRRKVRFNNPRCTPSIEPDPKCDRRQSRRNIVAPGIVIPGFGIKLP